jgi:hypothetical protein
MFAPNPRVGFLLNQRHDLRNWSWIPFHIGIMMAPLYDHRSAWVQVAVLFAVLVAGGLWERWFQTWIEARIRVFRDPQVFPRTSPGESLGSLFAISGALLLLTAAVTFLRRGAAYYPPDGFVEHSAAVWCVGAIILCVRRVLNPANLRERRLWNAIAAAVLVLSLSLVGSWPRSYSDLLVAVGSVNLALAILDIRLLLYLGPQRGGDREEAHA